MDRQKLKTRLFDVAQERNLNLTQLAQVTGIDLSTLSRVRRGQQFGIAFIVAAKRAFPHRSLSELFYVDEEKSA